MDLVFLSGAIVRINFYPANNKNKVAMQKQYLPFVEIFDSALERNEDRPLIQRDYIWASELGMSFFERYLKMNAVPPSNPPNKIAIRKFKIGRLIEDFFKLVLFEVGLLHKHEERVYSDESLGIKVSGKLDILYGGKFNINDINDVLDRLSFLSFIGVLSDAIKEFAEQNKNVDFELIGLEVKSVSDHIYNRIEMDQRPMEHHALQAFHYAKWTKIPFMIVYFDKNNARIQSFWVTDENEVYAKKYEDDIKQMAHYIKNDIQPEKEKLFSFGVKFSPNWQVEYSNYLESHYGFKSKQDYKDWAKPISDRWNRVLTRIKDGKLLTEDNKLAIQEMKKFGFDISVDVGNEDFTPYEEVNNVPKNENTDDKLKNLKNLLS